MVMREEAFLLVRSDLYIDFSRRYGLAKVPQWIDLIAVIDNTQERLFIYFTT